MQQIQNEKVMLKVRKKTSKVNAASFKIFISFILM